MENGPGLKIYFLSKMVMLLCYISLPEGNTVTPTPLSQRVGWKVQLPKTF